MTVHSNVGSKARQRQPRCQRCLSVEAKVLVGVAEPVVTWAVCWVCAEFLLPVLDRRKLNYEVVGLTS